MIRYFMFGTVQRWGVHPRTMFAIGTREQAETYRAFLSRDLTDNPYDTVEISWDTLNRLTPRFKSLATELQWIANHDVYNVVTFPRAV